MADAPVAIGEVLAEKYRIERVLGQGGMGVVAAAKHLQLDELVAIKFLLPKALEQPSLIARFNQEARAQIKVKSEHVARTIDVGTLANGAPYMVLEYLEGIDLAGLLQEHGPMPIQRTVDLVLQACEALAEAHALGIVHRDLKPANLFITRRADGSECLKVLDFGISKFTDGASGESLHLTRTNVMLGSPLYMSPEQLRSAKEVDGRSDVWSLGVILFELLSNSLPFYEEAIAQLCVSVMIKPLPNIQELVPQVPDGLKAAIEKSTAKELPKRFANIAEFAAAIAPFGSPEAARSVGRVQRIMADMVSRARERLLPTQADLSSTNIERDSDADAQRELQRLFTPVAVSATAISDRSHSFEHNDTVEGSRNPPTTTTEGAQAAHSAGEMGGPWVEKPMEAAARGPGHPHTLDGVAEAYPLAVIPRRWLIPAVAAAALVAGAASVVWVLKANELPGDAAVAASGMVPSVVAGPEVSPEPEPEPSMAPEKLTEPSTVLTPTPSATQAAETAPAPTASTESSASIPPPDDDAPAAVSPPSDHVPAAPPPAQSPEPSVQTPPVRPKPAAQAAAKSPPVVRKSRSSGSVYGERE